MTLSMPYIEWDNRGLSVPSIRTTPHLPISDFNPYKNHDVVVRAPEHHLANDVAHAALD